MPQVPRDIEEIGVRDDNLGRVCRGHTILPERAVRQFPASLDGARADAKDGVVRRMPAERAGGMDQERAERGPEGAPRRRGEAESRPMTPDTEGILALGRLAGNRAVMGLVASVQRTASPESPRSPRPSWEYEGLRPEGGNFQSRWISAVVLPAQGAQVAMAQTPADLPTAVENLTEATQGGAPIATQLRHVDPDLASAASLAGMQLYAANNTLAAAIQSPPEEKLRNLTNNAAQRAESLVGRLAGR